MNEVCSETDQSETSINETPPTQKKTSPIKTEENFLRIFLGFPQGLLRRRLNYRLSNSVVSEPQKFTLIKKNSSLLIAQTIPD